MGLVSIGDCYQETDEKEKLKAGTGLSTGSSGLLDGFEEKKSDMLMGVLMRRWKVLEKISGHKRSTRKLLGMYRNRAR